MAAALTAGFLIPSTATAAPVAAAPASTETVVPFSSTGWNYYRGTAAPASTWKTAAASWATGTAPFGFGLNTGTLGTKLPNSFTKKPLASYFQKSFSLDSVPASGVTLTTWADDAVIVYVNGKEAVRKNLKAGEVKDNSYATAAPQTTKAKASKVTVTVPASALKTGKNLLSAQVQSNWRNTHNISFDAQVTMTKAATVAPPTTAPTTPAKPTTPTTPATPEQPTAPTGAGAAWGTPAWEDNFTYKDAAGQPAVDPAKWNVRDRSDLGLLADVAVPSEKQVTVDNNGIAHLKADWLATPIKRTSGGGAPVLTHETGYMDQRVLKSGDMSYAQQYGRWEIRAKTPTGPKTYGALAAFWLRNSNSGEIDIMEAWGYNEKAAPGGQKIDTATTTVHSDTMGGGSKFFWTHSQEGATSKPWDGFHTYAFELTPTYASLYVDDVKIATATPKTHPMLWDKKSFNSPLHVRLNLHVGPSAQYWGLPDPKNKSWTQPLDYQVDYVKIWKYKG